MPALEPIKDVDYQALGDTLRRAGVKNAEVMRACGISRQQAYVILEGKSTQDPRHSIHCGLMSLAFEHRIEVPLLEAAT